MSEKNYDSTIMRIAGNIASGLANHPSAMDPFIAVSAAESFAIISVRMARAIVAEVLRTSEPKP